MTAPVWPDTTGFALVDGYSNQFPQLADRTEVDTGPAKQRYVGSGAPHRIQQSYLMTTAEKEWLRWFHASPDGGAGGAVWFDWTCPELAQVLPARFVAGADPAVTPKPPSWVVTVQLDVLLPLLEDEPTP